MFNKKERISRIKGELEEKYSGVKNAGRPMVLEGGLDWKPMSLTPKDMDFLEAKHAAAREIALAFGVPPMLLGIPGGLGVLSAIAAHKWVYNRQKELEAMHTASKPSPPRQIRLQAVPPPGAEQDDDQPLSVNGADEKYAGLNEIMDFMNKAETPAISEQQAEAIAEPVKTQVVKVAPGVIQITGKGHPPTEVEADSPESAEILRRSAPRLAKLLAAYQSTPASAMAA